MAPKGETARRLVHLGSGGIAFALRFMTPWQAAGCAAAAVLFNRFVLTRVAGAALFRTEERRHPWRSGIVIYPLAVLLLIGLFGSRLDLVAAGWAIMAAGDASAGLAGGRFGRRPVPWNRAKSAVGSIAFVLASTVAAWAVLTWMGRAPTEALLLALPTCLFAAFVESLPWKLDDNLTVPLLSALFLRALMEIDPGRLQAALPGLGAGLLAGAGLNLPLALLFGWMRLVDRSGAIAGFLVGTLTWSFAGWRGFLLLVVFFVLGSAATRLGRFRKERLGVAQEKRGARSARHALANCGVAVYLAFLLAVAGAPGVFVLAFVCAYATAAFDTVSSEIGQAFGGRPVLITTLRPVPIGTNGAVTWIGTLAGAAAAFVVAWLAVATELLPSGLAGVAVIAAFLGSTADSFLGATLEARGLLDNDAVNFSNTLVGALSGIGLAILASAPL